MVAGELQTGMACSAGSSPFLMYCRYTLDAGKMKSSISSYEAERKMADYDDIASVSLDIYVVDYITCQNARSHYLSGKLVWIFQ